MDQSVNVSEIGIIVNQLCKRVDHLERLAGVAIDPRPPQSIDLTPLSLDQVLKSEDKDSGLVYPMPLDMSPTPAVPQLDPLPQPPGTTDTQPGVQHAIQPDPISPPVRSRSATPMHPLLKAPTDPQPAPAKPTEGVELWIGRHLNRIGIALLVIGCAFGIVYEFQYFGPWLKIASGLLGGILLLLGGAWSEEKPTFQWCGRGITGGGWALIYFTVFAAHHFSSVRVIDSPLVDLVLLAGVSAGAVLHSFKFKSEAITSISLLLGFITTGISQVNGFSLASSFLLLAAMTWIVVKTGWKSFMIWGQALFYLIYCLLIAPQVNVAGLPLSMASITLKLLCATCSWLAFNTMIMSFGDEKVARHSLIGASLMNASVYVGQVLFLMDPLLSHWRFAFLVLLSTVYAAMAKVSAKRHLPMMETVQTTLALFLATSGLPFQFHGSRLLDLWLMEIPLLLWCGLQFSNLTLRRFALALSVFMAMALPCSDLLDTAHAFFHHTQVATTHALDLTVGLLSFLACAVICKMQKETNLIAQYRWFCTAAVVFSCMLAGKECAHDWLPLTQAMIFVAPVAIGLQQRDKFLQALGAVGISCLMLPNLTTTAWNPLAVLPIVPLMFAVSALYDKAQDKDLLMDKAWIKSAYRTLALYVLVQLTHQLLSGMPLLIGWSTEALVILSIALRKNDQFMRWAAATIFALMAGKFFVFDLFSNGQVIGIKAAILSSIVAAGALLVAAFMHKSADFFKLSQLGEPAAELDSWKNWFVSYFVAALSVCVASAWFNADSGQSLFFITVEFALCLLTGLRFGMANLRALAALGTFGLGTICLFANYSNLNLVTTILTVVILHGIAWLYRTTEKGMLGSFEEDLRWYYDGAGAVLLMVLSNLHAGNWLAVAWAFQGTALLAAGFLLKERPLRVFGLSVFGFVMMRLLFVELAHAETIYRILSFMVAGIVLLAASFAYARFSASERLVTKS